MKFSTKSKLEPKFRACSYYHTCFIHLFCGYVLYILGIVCDIASSQELCVCVWVCVRMWVGGGETLTWVKGMWIDGMLNPIWDLRLWPRSCLWPWIWGIFKFKFCESLISGMNIPMIWSERDMSREIICRESTGPEWIPLTKGQSCKTWYFLVLLAKYVVQQTVKLAVIPYAMKLMSGRCNVCCTFEAIRHVLTWIIHTYVA